MYLIVGVNSIYLKPTVRIKDCTFGKEKSINFLEEEWVSFYKIVSKIINTHKNSEFYWKTYFIQKSDAVRYDIFQETVQGLSVLRIEKTITENKTNYRKCLTLDNLSLLNLMHHTDLINYCIKLICKKKQFKGWENLLETVDYTEEKVFEQLKQIISDFPPATIGLFLQELSYFYPDSVVKCFVK